VEAVTLVDFLLARIAEDEAAARDSRALYGPDSSLYINRHNPARVLAECEAKRRIVELHSRDHECTAPGDGYAGVFAADGTMPSTCSTMRALALPFATHPDYREEWKP
jgi:hypothetical protein